METSKQRVFGLDALRAAAIGMVLVCHASIMVFPWFRWPAPLPLVYGGTYGVTLFFTLSGFLIGRILIRLAAQGAGWRDWLSFMRRRWARTLPLYGLWLLVLAAVWPPQALDPGAHERLLAALPWFATLTQNLAWPMRADWFGVSWSLCVEEWFYLVFSAALLAGGALLGRRLAFWLVLGAFLLVPPGLRAWAPGWSPAIHSDSGIVLLRLDAVGYGVLAAWLTLHAPWVMRRRRACLAGGMALAMVLLEGGFNPLLHVLGPWSNALTLVILPLAFALCLPAASAAAHAPDWLRRPVEALSDQSYGIYVCHLSMLEWVNYELRLVRGVSPLLCLVILVAAVWGFSFLSRRLLEQPILAWTPRLRVAEDRPGLRRGAAGA